MAASCPEMTPTGQLRSSTPKPAVRTIACGKQIQAGLRAQSFALVGGENVALVSIGQTESCGCGFSHAPVSRHPVGLLELPDNEALYK